MQTAVDATEQRPQPRRWLRWAAVGLVVAVVGATLLVVRGLTTEEQPPLTVLLASDLVSVLELASPDEHAHHGHDFGEESRVLCTAEVFGFDPPSATTVAEVEQVYALHKCALVSGLEWPMSVRAYGPLVMDLTGPDPRILLPGELDLGDGAVHADRIRALIPERYHQAALAPDFTDPALTDDLRQRLAAAS